MGNAIYRDLIQGSLMVDARFLVLAVPVEYRYKSGTRTAREPSYAKSYSVVEAIYGSPACNSHSRGYCSSATELGLRACASCSSTTPRKLAIGMRWGDWSLRVA